MAAGTFEGRRYGRIAAAVATLLGLGVAALVLASSETADFLGEGPARVLPYEGTARRLTMGIGTAIATLVVAWGVSTVSRRGPRVGEREDLRVERGEDLRVETRSLQEHSGRGRAFVAWAAIVVGMGAGLFLLHALFFPAAALFVVAIALRWLDGVPNERLAAWGPRAKPALWGAGGVATVPVTIGAVLLGIYLLGPLFDEGEELHEALAFEIPAQGQPAMSGPGTVATPPAGMTGMTTTVSMAPVARVLAEGDLKGEDSFHFGEGQVRVIRTPEGGHIVRFENYSVRNGPDLFVYVSPDAGGDVNARGAVNISELKATRGDVTYELPPNIDPASIRSVVIYCRQFKVTFAVATLTVM